MIVIDSYWYFMFMLSYLGIPSYLPNRSLPVFSTLIDLFWLLLYVPFLKHFHLCPPPTLSSQCILFSHKIQLLSLAFQSFSSPGSLSIVLQDKPCGWKTDTFSDPQIGHKLPHFPTFSSLHLRGCVSRPGTLVPLRAEAVICSSSFPHRTDLGLTPRIL